LYPSLLLQGILAFSWFWIYFLGEFSHYYGNFPDKYTWKKLARESFYCKSERV